MFGRIDDERPWRVGLYGIDDGGDQLVDRLAGAVRRASSTRRASTNRSASTGGSATSAASTTCSSRTSPPARSRARRRCWPSCRAAAARRCAPRSRRCSPNRTALVRLDPRARLVLRGGPGTGKTVVGLHRAAWLVYNDRGSPPIASSCSARATGSCASSPRCCRRWARRASCRRRSNDCWARRPLRATTSGGSRCSTRSRQRLLLLPCGQASVRSRFPSPTSPSWWSASMRSRVAVA